jgi:hypothetical protein
MGVFDKVKDQAREIKGKVDEKVDDVQGKRKSGELLADLGRYLYAERTDRPIGDAQTEIDRLVAELKKLEDDGLKILPDH